MLDDVKAKLIATYKLTDDYLNTLIEITKQRLGIMSDIKLLSITGRVYDAVLKLCDEREIIIDMNNAIQIMLIVDIAAWEYRNLEKNEPMPLDLRYRLNNAFIRDGA